MTALGQQHRRRALRVRPVAAHEAVRVVPVHQVFAPVDRHHLAQLARAHQLVDGLEEWRVAQHVADLQHAPQPFRGQRQVEHVLGRRGDWLFQQDVVAGFEQSERARVVRAVQGGVERHPRQLRSRHQVLPRLELAVERDAVRLGEAVAARLVGVDHRDEAQSPAPLERVPAVHARAAIAGADQHRLYRTFLLPALPRVSLSPAQRSPSSSVARE